MSRRSVTMLVVGMGVYVNAAALAQPAYFQLVPIRPYNGSDYPAGVSMAGDTITVPGGPLRLWFEVRLGGWGGSLETWQAVVDLTGYANGLGACLTALGQFDEAEPLLLNSYDKLKSAQGESGSESLKALKRIVKMYDAWYDAEPGKGYDAKADEWWGKLTNEESSDGQ